MFSTREEIADQMARLSAASGATVAVDMTSLPDLCLDRILDHLPLPDLLTIVPLVCWRWYHSRASACKRRRTLLLLQHPNQLDFVLKRRLSFAKILEYTVDEEGNSFGKPTENLDYLKDSVLFLSNLGQRISSSQLSTGLLNLFTNITDLRLVQTNRLAASDLLKVHQILLRLAPNLHTLYLWLWVNLIDNENNVNDVKNQQQQVYQHISKIFELINTLMRPKLRRLHLNLQVPWPYLLARDSVLSNLSILDQLEELDFRTIGLSSQQSGRGADPGRRHFDINEPLEALEQYAVHNPRLASIMVENPMDLSYCIRLPPSLASCITRVFLENWISRPNVDENDDDDIVAVGVGSSSSDLRALTTFCQRFHSLQVLTLSFTHTIPWEQIVKRLCGLKQLRHLTLRSAPSLSVTRHYSDQELEQYRSDDYAMPSVIALTLIVDTLSHEEFAMLQLPTFFPNTQGVWILHRSYHGCSECHLDQFGNPTGEQQQQQQQQVVQEHNNYGDDVPEAFRPVARCLELAIRPFARFGQLRHLHTNQLPVNWTERVINRGYTRQQLAAI